MNKKEIVKKSEKKQSLKGRAAQVGLSKAQVVAAAIAQIDERGLAKFSIRELARTLGVSTAVVYWHANGKKADLFAEISASITSTFDQDVDELGDWKETIRSIFRRYRTLVLQHPNVAPLLGGEMKSNGVANIRWVEVVLAALANAGFKGEQQKDAFNALIGGLAGFVTMELAPAPTEQTQDWKDSFSQRITEIDAEQFPHTHGALPVVTNRIFVLRWQNGSDVSYDASFEFLMNSLIEGLALSIQEN
ncbi:MULTISPECIES: TetR/AcrR family transcriptional regulator [Vibrio]|uniref:TetR family transcriptional regulator n=2 Tax=Vibrio TaxID=662 RepID=A0A7X4LPC5_9VIBR|nr:MULTISPECIES: TetR/AcrR family transcriptional regulator [Vibrio]MBF9003308.1 TetR/AcrR family transcriptional regulator C-terminal domain-containing protein [Vibrio nitrifigilis]MZI95684.1 TetR family transcriptional regulator [Vibrio eleionomae]